VRARSKIERQMSRKTTQNKPRFVLNPSLQSMIKNFAGYKRRKFGMRGTIVSSKRGSANAARYYQCQCFLRRQYDFEGTGWILHLQSLTLKSTQGPDDGYLWHPGAPRRLSGSSFNCVNLHSESLLFQESLNAGASREALYSSPSLGSHASHLLSFPTISGFEPFDSTLSRMGTPTVSTANLGTFLGCTMPPSLPQEVYGNISQFLGDRRELLSLCLVSRAFCHEAERILYESVDLAYDQSRIQRWFKMIASIEEPRFRNRAVSVHSLTFGITYSRPAPTGTWLKNIERGLRSLVNLKE
jgi:hypothetical protein